MDDYERYGDYQAEDRSTFSMAISLLLIGLGAGALVALLVAPKSGKQIRRMLRRKYEDAVDTINDRAGEWRERGSDLMERGSTLADAARERVAPFAKAARSRMRQ
ncbi:MAG: YtxH domain-containing protein [Acidobacteria bacterium]|nr:YtxH domain-containing protein [Acidobacteriaceae bacterium]MBV9610626.1 YtxH domain-containing protein [Acidobacteriota bacterium]